MKHKSIPFILTLVLLAAAFTGCAGKNAETDIPETEISSGSEEKSGSGLQPFSAPVSFETVSLDGESVSSDIVASSRLTMINVWATYCGPCLNEMPGLGELASEYAREDFQLLGIVSDVTEGTEAQGLEQARELVETTGASSYMHLLLSQSLYEGLLSDVSAVPTTFFVDADGRILDTVIGSMEKEDWKEKIDEFLEEL